MSDDGWPAELRRLVATHGPAAVLAAGLDVLGYPPVWGVSGPGLARLTKFLQGGSR